MVPQLLQQHRVQPQASVEPGQQLTDHPGILRHRFRGNELLGKAGLDPLQKLLPLLTVASRQKAVAQGHALDGVTDVGAGGRRVERRHGHALSSCQADIPLHGVGGGIHDPILLHQIAVKLHFQRHVSCLTGFYHPVYKGVHRRVQSVVCQEAIQVDQSRLRIRRLTGVGEKLPAGHVVIGIPQLTYGVFHQGIVEEKDIRPLQSHIIDPAEPLDTLAHIRRKLRQQEFAEAVMGIKGCHPITSLYWVYFTPSGKKKPEVFENNLRQFMRM